MTGVRGVVTGVACLLAAALAPACAQATIVYSHAANVASPPEIWAMNDDGTNQHVLVPLASVAGMEQGLSAPSVDPIGGTVVAFDGTTFANQVLYNDPACACGWIHYGLNSTGVYTFSAGTVSRLSAAPATCAAADGCTTGDINPQPTGAGYTYFDLSTSSGLPNTNLVTGSRIYKMNLDGSARADYGTACDDSPTLSEGAPNWSDPAQIAYNGCADADFYGELMLGSGGAAGTVVGKTVLPGGRFGSVAFSPDGSSIVAYDNSFSVTSPGPEIYSNVANDAGLYLFSPSGTGAPIRKLLTGPVRDSEADGPEPITLDSPHFVGPNTIVFAVDGQLWTIPASCDNCSFPADAHELTSTGYDDDPAWTSATVWASDSRTGGTGGTGGTTEGTGGTVAHCKVPKLAGLTVAGARAALSRARCSLGKIRRKFERRGKRGRVVAQSRRPGTVAAEGLKVAVTVSKGKRGHR